MLVSTCWVQSHQHPTFWTVPVSPVLCKHTRCCSELPGQLSSPAGIITNKSCCWHGVCLLPTTLSQLGPHSHHTPLLWQLTLSWLLHSRWTRSNCVPEILRAGSPRGSSTGWRSADPCVVEWVDSFNKCYFSIYYVPHSAHSTEPEERLLYGRGHLQ